MEVILAQNLIRTKDGYLMDIRWPYGGRNMGTLGPRVCETMRSVLGLLKAACANTVTESREPFFWDEEWWLKIEPSVTPGAVLIDSIYRDETGSLVAVFPGGNTTRYGQPVATGCQLSFQGSVDILLPEVCCRFL